MNGGIKAVINVTQEDLDRGVRNDCSNCPVARAILREIPDVEYGFVDGTHVNLKFVSGDVILVKLPAEVTFKILQIDDGKKVDPFTFEICHPEL